MTSATGVLKVSPSGQANVRSRNGGNRVDVSLLLAYLERSRRQIPVHSLEAKMLGSSVHGQRGL